MWIELQNDFDSYLKKINKIFDKRAIAINELFESMLKSHHMVYADRNILIEILKCDFINKTNKEFIRWILDRYLYIYPSNPIVNKKIIVITEGTFYVEGDVYYVPLMEIKEFRETRLLTENEMDAYCFKKIFTVLSKQKGVFPFDIEYENISFHGGNVDNTIKNTGKENRLALCIVDSDKDYKDANVGTTSKKAHEAWKEVKDKQIIEVYELGVREKENLFPPCFYIPFCKNNKKMLETLTTFCIDSNTIKFFDIKDGVRYTYLLDTIWKEKYSVLLKKIEKNIGVEIPSGEEIKDAIKEKKGRYVSGIGSNACDYITKAYLGEDKEFYEIIGKCRITKNDLKLIEEKRKNIIDYIPKYLLEEWDAIYSVIFDWGCCLSKGYLSIIFSE